MFSFQNKTILIIDGASGIGPVMRQSILRQDSSPLVNRDKILTVSPVYRNTGMLKRLKAPKRAPLLNQNDTDDKILNADEMLFSTIRESFMIKFTPFSEAYFPKKNIIC